MPELYEVTSLSVNIEDDEPKEKSVVSFSRNSYTSKDGNATVTIKRKKCRIFSLRFHFAVIEHYRSSRRKL